MSPEALHNMVEELRNHAGRKFGIIKCYGPNGEYFEARSHREASELTLVSKTSVYNALKYNEAAKGWRFVREKEDD